MKKTQWTKVLTEKSFKKRIWSYWTFWILVLTLSLGAWQVSVHIEEWGDSARERIEDAEGLAAYLQYVAAAKYEQKLQEADTYGGSTPQETWEMFVTALKAEDTDLAAKYFVVWKQDEMTETLQIANKIGNISILLDDLDLIIGTSMYPNGKRFEYYTDSINGGANFVYTLVLNEETNIWKIESL